jgi:hypothetical protein
VVESQLDEEKEENAHDGWSTLGKNRTGRFTGRWQLHVNNTKTEGIFKEMDVHTNGRRIAVLFVEIEPTPFVFPRYSLLD